MTEEKWLRNPRLVEMVRFLIHRGSDRRHRLFACACCRQVWELVRLPAARRIVELSEACADNEASLGELRAANNPVLFTELEGEAGYVVSGTLSACALQAIEGVRRMAHDLDFRQTEGALDVVMATTADRSQDYLPAPDTPWGVQFRVPLDRVQFEGRIKLLRDIFGNPFRPVAFKPEWRTSTVVRLAHSMYESRDFSAMPILADALQDAGCDSQEILSHCLGEGSHVRGCWLVDLLRGKEVK